MKKTVKCSLCDGIGTAGSEFMGITCFLCSGTGFMNEDGSQFGGSVEEAILLSSAATIIEPSTREKLENVLNSKLKDSSEEENLLDDIIDNLLDELKITDYKDRLFAKDMFVKGFFFGLDAEAYE